MCSVSARARSIAEPCFSPLKKSLKKITGGLTIRAAPKSDATNGFFVALFERCTSAHERTQSAPEVPTSIANGYKKHKQDEPPAGITSKKAKISLAAVSVAASAVAASPSSELPLGIDSKQSKNKKKKNKKKKKKTVLLPSAHIS